MKLKRMPLYTRLLLILLAVIIPICVIAVRTNQMQRESALGEVRETRQAQISFYGEAIAQEIARMQKSTYQCVNDSDFIKLSVFYDVMSDYERVEVINKAREKLKLLREMSPYAANISIYMPSMERKVDAVNCDLEVTEEEMRSLLNRDMRSGLLTVYGGRLYLCSVYPSGQQLMLNPSMLMAIEIEQERLQEALRGIAPEEKGEAFIIGENLCLTTGAEADTEAMQNVYQAIRAAEQNGSELQTIVYQGENCVLSWASCEEIGGYIISCTPVSIVLSRLQRIDILIVTMVLIALVMTIVAAVWEFQTIHLPLMRLMDAFTQVENGNYDVRLTVRQHGQFEKLYNSFNHMMVKIQELIDQVYKQRILSQQAQLKQLQSQINPHFFYNSFFIIQGMLNMGEYEAADQMLGTLGRYFQFVTRSGREFVSIQREISHAWAYCEVQQIRFRSIHVTFEPFEEDLVGMQVPRLILQPLIENAYVHGLENVSEGELHVWAERKDDLLMIHVDNSGTVITDEEIEQLHSRLDAADNGEFEVTALINIHRRLKLYYGDGCGLRISRLDDGKTRTTLILRVEVNEHVQDSGGGQ